MAGVGAAAQTSPVDVDQAVSLTLMDEGTIFAETPGDVLLAYDKSPPAHATTNEHGQTLWADEVGVSWCQDPDGSLKRYDAESGTWVPHQ